MPQSPYRTNPLSNASGLFLEGCIRRKEIAPSRQCNFVLPYSCLGIAGSHHGSVGGNRLVALSSSSLLFGEQSSNPDERYSAMALGRAEERVLALCRQRGIAWTIFRPTLIYDPGFDRNISRIAAFVQRFRFFPVVWPGAGQRQPIHAGDVAQAMVAASSSPRARNMLFDLPGGETLTYREMVRRIFESLGKRPVLVYLPLSFARAAFYLWQTLTGEKYSSASLERMNMALTLDPAPVQEALKLTSRPFRPEFPDLK